MWSSGQTPLGKKERVAEIPLLFEELADKAGKKEALEASKMFSQGLRKYF